MEGNIEVKFIMPIYKISSLFINFKIQMFYVHCYEISTHNENIPISKQII